MGIASSVSAGDVTSSTALSGPFSGPCSPPSPRGRLIQAAALTSIPPGEATGQPNKRRGPPPDDVGNTVGGDGKHFKGLGNGGVSGPIMLYDVGQLQSSDEETQSLLFSCHPTGAAASGKVLDSSGTRQNVQQIRYTICHRACQRLSKTITETMS